MRSSSGSRLPGSIRVALVTMALGAAGGLSAKSPADAGMFDISSLRAVPVKRVPLPARDEYIDPAVAAPYIVQLVEPALAMHDGSDGSLPTPAGRNQRGRLDVKGTAARAYLSFLGQRQDDFLAQASSRLGSQMQPVRRMAHALNAVVLKLTPAQAAELSKLPSVKRIERSIDRKLDTDTGPTFIGAPSSASSARSTGNSTPIPVRLSSALPASGTAQHRERLPARWARAW